MGVISRIRERRQRRRDAKLTAQATEQLKSITGGVGGVTTYDVSKPGVITTTTKTATGKVVGRSRIISSTTKPTPTQTPTKTPTKQISTSRFKRLEVLARQQEVIRKQRQRVRITRRETRKQDREIAKRRFLKTELGKKVDVIAGGRLTIKQVSKDQERLNNAIENFNEKFGDKELTESEFERAEAQSEILQERQDKLNERISVVEKQREQRFKGIKKTISDISEKKGKLREERVIRVLERRGLEPTKENISGLIALKEAGEDIASRDIQILITGAFATPSGIIGKAVPKKVKKKDKLFLAKTKEQLEALRKTQKRLQKFEKKLETKKKLKAFEKEKLIRIKKTRKRLAKFEKQLKKSKDIIPVSKKGFVKPSKARLKKIKARRKKLKKFREKLEPPKKIKKLEEEKLKRILARRKKLAKFKKKSKIEKKLKKFEKAKQKKILARRKKLAKFQKKLKVKKKLEKFEKLKQKKILKRRKKFTKFKKQTLKEQKIKQLRTKRLIQKRNKIIKRFFITQKLRGKTPDVLKPKFKSKSLNKFNKEFKKRIKNLSPQQKQALFNKISKLQSAITPTKKIKPRKITRKIEPPKFKPSKITFTKIDIPKGNAQQILKQGPQEFKLKLAKRVRQMTPEQRTILNNRLKQLKKKVETQRFNINNELIKQGKGVKLTEIQKLSLQRGRENLQKLKSKNNKIVNKVRQTNRRINTFQRSGNQKQLSKQKLKQRQLLNEQRLVRNKIGKLNQKAFSSLLALSLFKQAQLSKIKQRQLSKLRQKQRQAQKQGQAIKQRQAQRQKARLRQLQKQKQKQKVRKRIQRIKPAIIKRRKKVRIKKKPKKKEAGYDVFARPIKKRKGQKKPKLIKVSKVPLKKSRARDLRNYIADQSLSRTAKIKATKKKAKKPKLKVPVGYAKRTNFKFRKHRTIKGKRKPLQRGKVIEKRTRLLDTRSERKGITLRRKVSQLEKKSGFKPTKRKPVKRLTQTRTTSSKKDRRFIKGSKEAKDHMAKLRRMR